MDLFNVAESEIWKFIAPAVGAVGAWFGYKNWSVRRERLAAMRAEQADKAKVELDRRFGEKADVSDLERLAAEVPDKSELAVLKKDVHNLKTDVTSSKMTERTIFEYIRQSDQRNQDNHNAVMGQLVDIAKRLPKA